MYCMRPVAIYLMWLCYVFISKEGFNSHKEQADIARALKEKFPNMSPASSWVIVSGLSLPEWLIEIEAHAVLN